MVDSEVTDTLGYSHSLATSCSVSTDATCAGWAEPCLPALEASSKTGIKTPKVSSHCEFMWIYWLGIRRDFMFD
jgi:hypothetical protein